MYFLTSDFFIILRAWIIARFAEDESLRVRKDVGSSFHPATNIIHITQKKI